MSDMLVELLVVQASFQAHSAWVLAPVQALPGAASNSISSFLLLQNVHLVSAGILWACREDEAPADIRHVVDACFEQDPKKRPSAVEVFELFTSSCSDRPRPPSRALHIPECILVVSSIPLVYPCSQPGV